MKQTIIFIIFVLAVVGVLYSVSGERSARIPEDENHKVWDRNDYCLDCHGQGRIMPRSGKHPPKDDCVLCHKVKKGRK